MNNMHPIAVQMNNQTTYNNVLLADGYPSGTFIVQKSCSHGRISGRSYEDTSQMPRKKRKIKNEHLRKVKLGRRAENKKGGELVDRSKMDVSSVYWDCDDPEQIGVWCRVTRVMNVFIDTQEIEVKVWLTLVWRDADLCNKYKTMGYDSKTFNVPNKEIPDIKSLPKVFFANITGSLDFLDESCQLSADFVGPNTVCWTRLLQARFCDPVRAYNFPFDYEDFLIHLRIHQTRNRYFCLFRPRMWRASHIKETNLAIAEHSNSYICPDNSHVQEWTICSFMNQEDLWYAKFDNDKFIRMLSKVNGHRGGKTCYFAYIVVKRSWRFYIVNIWSLFVLSTYFSLLSFNLDPDNMRSDRLNFTAAILFLQIGVRFTVIDNIPKLSYLTTMDIQIYFSIVIVMLQAFLQSLLYAVSPISGISLRVADTWLFYFWFCLITLLHTGMWTFAKCRQKKDRLYLQERAKMFVQSPDHEASPFLLKSTLVDPDEVISGKYKTKSQ